MDPKKGSIIRSVVERPLSRGRNEVSLSAFSLLFSEMVRYAMRHSSTTADLEKRLENVGVMFGIRIVELVVLRDRGRRRETKLLDMLQFIHGTLWKILFGKVGDGIERSTEHDDECSFVLPSKFLSLIIDIDMIADRNPLVNKFISVPRDMPHLNCAAYVAGIIKGVLDSSGFPARVSAHTVDTQGVTRTVFLMKFDPSVISRV